MYDTIIAVSTPPLNGAIGIVRVSGINSLKILNRFFKPFYSNSIKPRYATYGQLMDNNEKLDKCLAFYFNRPNSYTGEDMVEFHLHGSFFLLENFKTRVIASGLAREAMPGEFTKRGFENGKISLNDAEALNRLIKSETEMQIKLSNIASEGKLAETANSLKTSLLKLNASVEALIEYPEEVEDSGDYALYKEMLTDIIAIIDNLLNGYFKVQKIFEGIKVVVAGKPNSGKSSLINALAGFKRVIVTDIPGTTTDTIEVSLNIEGFKVLFVDTAGLRESGNLIEKEGVVRAKKEISSADLVLYLTDATENEKLPDINNDNVIYIYSKCDLLNSKDKNLFYISSKTLEGIEKLKKLIVDKYRDIDLSNGVVITSRQYFALQESLKHLKTAYEELCFNQLLEIVSYEISKGIWHLETLIGTVTPNDVLDTMFGDFCLGK
jgi:tRNA modification GTPase